jgi:hypothetical protein
MKQEVFAIRALPANEEAALHFDVLTSILE